MVLLLFTDSFLPVPVWKMRGERKEGTEPYPSSTKISCENEDPCVLLKSSSLPFSMRVIYFISVKAAGPLGISNVNPAPGTGGSRRRVEDGHL